MNKEFVKYEQALALKELGFDEPCLGYYYNGKIHFNSPGVNLPGPSGEQPLPLYQQAFRWFREKYNLVFNFMSYDIVKPGEYHWSITWNDEAKAYGAVKTYEEAESTCLDKLIKLVKNNNTSK